MTGRSPYTGRRPPTASARLLDEGRVVKRYEQTKNMAQVARELGINAARVRAILDARGVTREKKEPGETAVLRSYDRTGCADVTATLLGISPGRVTEILDRYEVPRNEPAGAGKFSRQARQQLGERRRSRREPSPADLLRPAEAAEIAGVTKTALLVGAAHGVLRNYGSVSFPAYRRDEVTALAERGNAGGRSDEEDSSDQ